MNKTDETITISFPDLSPAQASVLAKELRLELTKVGVPEEKLAVSRTDSDAQDMGTLLMIFGSAWFLDMLAEGSKGFVKGMAAGAGRATFDWLLRKYGTSAKIERHEGPPILIGEEHSRNHAAKPSFPPQHLSDLKTLGLVILGADKFPHQPADKNLDNPAFKNSAEAAKELFSSRYTLFRETHILDLFNADHRTDDIVSDIAAFAAKHDQIRDIILYYVGHGDFLAQQDRRYYLMLKNTRPGFEPNTALPLRDFRYMIENQQALFDRRCYFILDSCFAAAAVDAFQFQGAEAAVSTQIQNDILPARGWAFLAASDRDVPAIGKDGSGYTMFAGAMREVLKGENWRRPAALTLDDLSAEIGRYINDRHGGNGVKPQCHAPQQADGDISRLPLFVLPTPAGKKWQIPAEAPETATPEETAAYEALITAPRVASWQIASCEKFLLTWPNSPYAIAVRPLLERVRRDAAAQVQKDKDEQDRRQREEEAKRLREAKERHEQEAASIWAQLEAHGEKTAIADFVKRYGDTPAGQKAQATVQVIGRQAGAPSLNEYQAYAQLMNSPSMEDARRFAQDYPDSKLAQNIVQKVADKIKQLQQEEQQRQSAEQAQKLRLQMEEEKRLAIEKLEPEAAQIWEQLKTLDDLDVVSDFIKNFAGTKAAQQATDHFWPQLGERWIASQTGNAKNARKAWDKITEVKKKEDINLWLDDDLMLTSLPAELWHLTRLEWLLVYSNQLTSLPPEIGQLKRLELLDVSSNQLTSLPPEIGQLKRLKWLNVQINRLTQLPAEIWQLTWLERLDAYRNQLTSLPPEIGQLKRLEHLHVKSNQLTSLPAELGLLAANLRGTETIGDDPCPRLLLANNPLTPPLDRLWLQGKNDAVLNYLKAQYDKGLRGQVPPQIKPTPGVVVKGQKQDTPSFNEKKPFWKLW